MPGRQIVVLGGGPAGLTAARILKLRQPSWDVTVVERQRPDATFGYGVGLSFSSLNRLRTADPELTAAIESASVSAAPAQFMHHTSWQVNDVDEVGRGAAGMLAADPARHAWGLGRHNVGGNFFWYLRDPAGNYAEYYSDLDIITEQLRWDAHEWGARESVCAWGPPPPRGFFRPDDLAELMMKGDGR